MKRWLKRGTKPVLDDALAAALGQAHAPITPTGERADVLRARVLAYTREPQGDLHGLVTVQADAGDWRWFAPGVTIKDLYLDEAARARSFLLKLEPGARLPPHEHHADEECMVLEGELTLGNLTVSAGGYHLAPAGVPHGEITTRTGALIFLRAGLSDEVPRGARWVQSAMRSLRGE
jgi:quercetin dioxygenase-like cupin family protein